MCHQDKEEITENTAGHAVPALIRRAAVSLAVFRGNRHEIAGAGPLAAGFRAPGASGAFPCINFRWHGKPLLRFSQ